MSRMHLTPVAEQELLQARERFTLPILVWDVFEGITPTSSVTPSTDSTIPTYGVIPDTDLNKLRLQTFVPTTLAKQIEQEQHRIFTLVYPISLPLHYIATPLEKAFIDPDIAIRRLNKFVLIGVSDRLSYLGPLPDIMGKARPLIEKKIDPMDQGAVKELKATVPGHYYTIANTGLISFLKEAKKVGYLQQATNEFIVDDSNRKIVQDLNVDNV